MLNQSGEEPVECPLCMEPLEVDDLTFFPCTCGYQICRFCWHRIRTDENGLCPACRKAYPENPADFRPLSKEEVARLKAQKKQKVQKRKQKITENRKHLANIRVVQRNLVFVVGLPSRLADAEVLKKHEYFGKFGKIQKVVINQSTSYAGSQGPSASAYVTYQKADDALRAIQAVNNITVDGRTIRSSLGTTKYCSHFLKNQMCPKPECMYLHELGDAEASFTKEEVQQGKHQDYEKKLHEQLLNTGKDSKKLVPSTAVTSSISNSQNVNSTSCTSYVESNVKEVHARRQAFGHNNDNVAASSSGDSKGNHSSNRRHKNCQVNNHEAPYTSDKETKRKKDCEAQDDSESKQIPSVQNGRISLKHNGDKLNLSEAVNKINKDRQVEVLGSEDYQKSDNVSANLGSCKEKRQPERERGILFLEPSPSMNNSSFFTEDSPIIKEAVNMQGILPPENWRTPFHFPSSSSSTNVQEWDHSPGSSLGTLPGSSQLHSIKYDNSFCDIGLKDVVNRNHNSYIGNNLHISPAKSEVVAGPFAPITAIDRQLSGSEDIAGITNSCMQGSIKPQPYPSMGVMYPPSFVHYDPAILMINQFTGSSNGSQFLFMNGQPSQITKRFLEDVQKAQQQKTLDFQPVHSHFDLGARGKFDVNSEFNIAHCNTPMVNGRDIRLNGYQNDSAKLSRMQEHPPGFLYHQNKNKDADMKYINSVINPIMSAVQISDNKRTSDDDLGFDPFHETQKALAEMMEKESKMQHGLRNQHNAVNHLSERFNHQPVDGYHSMNAFNNQQQQHQQQQQPILQQQNSRLPTNVTGCEKFLDGLGLCRGMSSGASLSRSRLPPPGFAAPHQVQPFGISQSPADANM